MAAHDDQHFNLLEKGGLSTQPTQLTATDTKDLLATISSPRRRLEPKKLPASLSFGKLTKGKGTRQATPLLSPKEVVPQGELFKLRRNSNEMSGIPRGSAAKRLQGFYISVGKNIEVALTGNLKTNRRPKSTFRSRKVNPPVLPSLKRELSPLLKQLYARSFVFFS